MLTLPEEHVLFFSEFWQQVQSTLLFCKSLGQTLYFILIIESCLWTHDMIISNLPRGLHCAYLHFTFNSAVKQGFLTGADRLHAAQMG